MSALGWLLSDDLPLLSAAEPRPWADAPDDLPAQLGMVLRPLVRALLLAGYRTYRLDMIRSDPAQPGTVSLTPVGLTAGTEPTIEPPSAGAGVVLAVADLIHDRAASAAGAGGWLDPRAADSSLDLRSVFTHALEVSASQAAPWTGLVLGVTGEVVLWSGSTLVDGESPQQLNAAWTKEIADGVLAIATDVQNALADRLAAGQVTPLTNAGLLWLLNPLFWYAHDVTFPGTAFRPEVVGAPLPPLPWPAVVSAAAQGLDPARVRADEAPPADPDVSQLTKVAGQVVPALLATTHVLLGAMIQHPGGTGGDLRALLTQSRGRDLAALEWRWSVACVRELAGDELADRMFFERTNWLELLLELAEVGTISPAGYPATLSGAAAGDDDADPVLALHYPAVDGTPERVVLEVRGVAAVTVTATPLCEIGLLDAFCWDYLAAEPPAYLLTLVVVAGPGVAVSPGIERGLGWDLEVIRAWNYKSVPQRGARIQPELLLNPFPLNWEPDVDPTAEPEEWAASGMPMYGARVYPLPHGVALEYPMARADGDKPQWRLVASAPEGSGESRIAYDLAFGHTDTATEALEPTAVAVSMWVSPDVQVTLEHFWGSHSDAPRSLLEVWRINDPGRVPLLGAGLPQTDVDFPAFYGPALPEPDVTLPAGATRLEFPLPDIRTHPYFNQIALMIDIAVGAIPVVGDVVDIIELSVSLYTGRDKWGRPMSFYEQLLMAGCMFVPGVSNSVVKKALSEAPGAVDDIMGFALNLIRGQNRALLDYVDALRGLPKDATELLDLAETSRSFNRFDMQRQAAVLKGMSQLGQYLVAAERVGRTVGEDLAEIGPLELVDLLTLPGNLYLPGLPRAGQPRVFWLRALQEPFEGWCRSRVPRRTGNEQDVLEWVRTTRNVPQAILEALLGNRTLARLDPAQVALRSPRISAHWGCLGPMARRVSDSVANAADYERIGGLIPVADAVRRLADEAEQDGQRVMFSSDNRLLEFATPAELQRHADRVVQLLTGLSPSGQLDVALAPGTMSRLLGDRLAMEPADLAEALLRGMAELDRTVAAMAQATNVPGLTTEAYLRFAGHESFFKDLLTQAGYQQSSLFESRVAAEEFIRLWGPGNLVPAVRDPEQLFTLQSLYPDGQKGPDLVRLFDELGEARLQIVESKSWARAWMLGQPSSSMVSQIERFIGFAEDGFQFTLPNGLSLPTHREIIVRINPEEYAALRHISVEAAKRDIDDWLAGLGSTLEDIRETRGWTVTIEVEPLYVVWQR